SAMSGAMGGSASEEFLAPTPVGEDTFVRCASCGFAANVEAVTVPAAGEVAVTAGPAHVENTPNTPTIDTLVEVSNARPELARTGGGAWSAADTLKNVIVMRVDADGKKRPLAIGLPGDRDVDERRLEAAVYPAEIAPFEEADFAANPALVKGYIGPGALGQSGSSGIEYLLDPRVARGTAWITGANEPGRHVYDLVHGRDFEADGVIDVAEVRAGDACPSCGAEVEIARGIEIGHIFQLGRKYAEALGLQVQDESGELVTVTMGSYGIGVSRAVAAIAEQHHDDKGLVWPREIAPADVHVVATGKDDAVFSFAEDLVSSLSSSGVRVLFDDRRGVSPGVKFNDSELIGVPTIVVVGRGLADGTIEVKDRASGERVDVPVDEAVAHLVSLVRS
ncbi:MAG TPA: His/Gly/Thr/Pro-type tRNA ligase C-terminal domain-containing protein, partial [Candidatus Nanopelagicales bacterium]|nr:His/Gly/Thr/Pro-type tRNA ligase C-terminal domain-containing protein [Candidatus Nanopelagicales bacterium]